jgi:predicted glycosyltransferase
MTFNQFYYFLKPLIPRSAQIYLRRMIVARKRARYAGVWPIDERAGNPPDGWTGWPERKKFALVLTHDVDTDRGQGRCRQLMELEERLGFRSAFGFVAERYAVSADLRRDLRERGFEVYVHGLYHDGLYYTSRETFLERAARINHYLVEWKAAGFRSPSMQRNLDWFHDLCIEYDSSTFDTDPFEPQSDGVGTIFPFRVRKNGSQNGYIELPYTLPQDFTLFVMMGETDIGIWKRKLDWIVKKGGMALINTHPDYMHFGPGSPGLEEYPARYYEEFLRYAKTKFEGQYWHVLPNQLVHFGLKDHEGKKSQKDREDSRKESEMFYPLPKAKKTIWIDLDNSPHVPFFKPIINELNHLGYRVVITARDCSQTCGLADLLGIEYSRIGRHYGKNRFLKVAGTLYRGWLLAREIKKENAVLGISHGSRGLNAAARILGIPALTIADYEHAKGLMSPTWMMVPEVISNDLVHHDKNHVLHYPGIKEDVYVPFFKPDGRIFKDLGIDGKNVIITLRPPATEAHYHNPESEALFREVVKLLAGFSDVKMIILPRTDNQKAWMRGQWPALCDSGTIIIPEQVVDGLNLLWHSDLVISGGGTMNREAAALGVPVYSIFRGKIGAVDRYLSENGRLVLLEKVEDLFSKLKIEKRTGASAQGVVNRRALKTIVEHISSIMRAMEAV